MKVTIKPWAQKKAVTKQVTFSISGLLVAGVVVWITIQNYGLMLAAAVVAVLYFSIGLLERGEKVITVENGWLKVMQGDAYLWGTSMQEFAGMEVVAQEERFGFLASPLRVVFRRKDGDSFEFNSEDFDDETLNAIKSAIEQGKSQ